MTSQAAYDELLRLLREQALLTSVSGLLVWDESVCLPVGGVAARGDQLAYLAGLEHVQATQPRFAELLDILEAAPALEGEAAAVNVREARRRQRRMTRLPRALVEDQARVASFAQHAWASARRKKDFGVFRPWLEKIVALKQQEAACLSDGGDPYDALLDVYEPGMRGTDLVHIFDALGRQLLPLLERILDSKRRMRHAILRRSFPIERQKSFGLETAKRLGFDLQKGRIDVAVHPFCALIGPGDCRIAVRFRGRNFGDGFFTILHEVGHGLYDQGLDPAHAGTPFGACPSLGLHEAQARLLENQVGRSLAFWTHFFPQARMVFPEALGKVRLDEFYGAVNHVEPGLNRVSADEVTYNLHIHIRFKLERALIHGDLHAADLPCAWDEACRRTLGETTQTAGRPRGGGTDSHVREGCLQDGHWSEGMFGYFPTYTIGNLIAAQLMDQARRDIGGLDEAMTRGDFSDLLRWLREKVHRQGSRYPTARLVASVAGRPLDHQALVVGLERKFGELYQL